MEHINWQNRSKPSLCRHSIRSYGFNRLLGRIQSWSSSNSALRCQECEKEEMGKSSKKMSEEIFRAKFLWVCLDCDQIFCGAESLGQPVGHISYHAMNNNHLFAIPIAAWCFDCKSIQQIMTLEMNKELDSPIEVKKELGGMEQRDFDNLPGGYVVRPMQNFGNTCFFNAILQNLLSMGVLRANFEKLQCQNRSITHDLWSLFDDTSEVSDEDMEITGHGDLLAFICWRVPSFRGQQEQDSHELLRQLLGLLLAEGTGFIEDIFGGKLSSTVSCVRCENASKSYEPFLDLSLAIPSNECSTKKDEDIIPKDHVPSAIEISSCPSKRSSSLLEQCLSEEKPTVPPGAESLDLSSQFSSVKPNVCSRKRPRCASSLNFEGQTQSGNNNGDPLSIEKCLDLFTAPENLYGEYACDYCSNHSQDHPQPELQTTRKNEKFMGGNRLGGHEVMDEVKPEVESNAEGVDIGSRMVIKASDRYHYFKALAGHEVMDEVNPEVESEDERVDVGRRKAKMKASKRYLIFKAPRVLTIHLKRFTQDTNGIIKKINSHVSIQEMLDLTPYMDPSCEDKEKPRYRLIGVVEHLGTNLMGGHYVAYVRGVRSEERELAWFRASDHDVRKASLNEVLNREAYIFFMKECDPKIHVSFFKLYLIL